MIIHSREEFAVYGMADLSVPYGQFVQFLDRVGASIPGLLVILVTEKLSERLLCSPVVRFQSKQQSMCRPATKNGQENGFRAPSMDARIPHQPAENRIVGVSPATRKLIWLVNSFPSVIQVDVKRAFSFEGDLPRMVTKNGTGYRFRLRTRLHASYGLRSFSSSTGPHRYRRV